MLRHEPARLGDFPALAPGKPEATAAPVVETLEWVDREWVDRGGLGNAPDADAPLEDRLARLAAAVGPLRRVLAAIAARVVETRGHERLCYARLGDYARERPGVSARQLQDLARVHRALALLPALERALVANALPWSKVRLLARVAAADDEEAWIARARRVSTRRLEHEVRARAREGGSSEEPEDPEEGPRRRVSVRCTPALREEWEAVRELAERVAGERLRTGEVLELVVAEAFSELGLEPALAERAEDGPAGLAEWRGPRDFEADPPPSERSPAARLPDEVRALARGLEDADPFELDRRLCRAVRLEQTLDARLAPLLRAVRSAEHEWRGDRHRPLARYAPDALGMSARKARALVRLERAGDVCPELRRAFRSGRLSWVKVQCLLPLVLLDIEGAWRGAWVAWAARATVRRLEADVARALLLRAGHHDAWHRCKAHPERARDPIPPGERQLCAPDVDPEATEVLAWRVPGDVAALFRGVRETVRARLGGTATDGAVFAWMLEGAIRTWTQRAPGARRHPVMERDGWRCVVPGCTSRRNLHVHHVRFRSAGGSEAAENRVTLCAFHHLRCLHAGRMGIRGRAPEGLVFELGLRAGGPPLACYRSGDVYHWPPSMRKILPVIQAASSEAR